MWPAGVTSYVLHQWQETKTSGVKDVSFVNDYSHVKCLSIELLIYTINTGDKDPQLNYNLSSPFY